MAAELTVTLTVEDGERLIQAFKEGKLAELGILDVKFDETMSREAHEQRWSDTESKRRRTPRRRDRTPSD